MDPEVVEQSVDEYVNSLYDKIHEVEEASRRHSPEGTINSPNREEMINSPKSEVTF